VGILGLQQVLFLVFNVVIFGLSAWALVDLLTRPARAFPVAGKRTKGLWGAITGGATVVSFLSIPLGIQFLPSFFALLAAVGAIVYLVDVRPAVAPYSRRGPRGPRGPSGGGW